MRRVKFRDKTRRLAVPEGCPGCGAAHGEYHYYGCRLEPCPKCGGQILHCHCKALSRADGILLAAAVAESIRNKETTIRVVFDGVRGLSKSYFGEGVLAWFVLSAQRTDPEKIEWALSSLGFGKAGDGYIVTPEALAEMLHIPVSEAAVLLNDLQANFQGKLIPHDSHKIWAIRR